MNQIGMLGESALHAALKEWIARPGDRLEAAVDGYLVDVVRGEQLIEVQTGNFSSLKPKLARLLPHHPVQIVYPIPQDKWIVRVSTDGELLSRRKSPKHGRFLDAFAELVRIPHLLPHPNLTLRLLLTRQEEIWLDDGRGSWRRKYWSIAGHRLLAVVGEQACAALPDLARLLPPDLPQPFTNRQLARAAGVRPRLAQQITYTLRGCGALEIVGKDGRFHLHQFHPPTPDS